MLQRHLFCAYRLKNSARPNEDEAIPCAVEHTGLSADLPTASARGRH